MRIDAPVPCDLSTEGVPISELELLAKARDGDEDALQDALLGRAVLARPLRPGSIVVILSSGAAVNPNGSPLSGGYAGAKRMQLFLAGYRPRSR